MGMGMGMGDGDNMVEDGGGATRLTEARPQRNTGVDRCDPVRVE
jgi:hypothetical protein